jgi:ABC-type transport system involved in multi-copper enzyme maturation permease subunit
VSVALTVLQVTLREGLRRRLLLALFGLSVVAVLLTAWGYSQLHHLPPNRNGALQPAELQLIASQLLILVMFMFSFVLALSAVFAAAPSVAGELESGEALAVLARPVRRRDVLFGKWLGLSLVVVVYAALASSLEFGAALLTTGYLPPHPIEAALYLAGMGLTLLTVTLLLSTRVAPVTAGIVAMLLFGLAWLAGVVGGIGTALGDPATALAGTIGRILVPSDGLWRGALYSLEPGAVLLAGSKAGPGLAAFPFFAPAPPPLIYLAWAVIWNLGAFGLAIISLERRDL